MNPILSEPKRLFSWAFYDFANTIFSAIVLTSYFPLYVTTLSKQNVHFGIAATVSMLLAGIAMPFIGALSDQTGRTKRYLLVTTCITVFLFFSFSLTTHIFTLLLIFMSACFFYHSSLVFYNALLPCATPPKNQGFASGLGTGLGYLGVVCVLPLAHAADQQWGKPSVFAISAILFMIAAIPLFLNVPERKVPDPQPFRWSLWHAEWQRIMKLVRILPRHPALFLFLGGNFFLSDALNSMIFWFMVYAREVFNPSAVQLVFLLGSVNAAAFLWGLLSGYLTDKVGALQMLAGASFILTLTLVILSKASSYSAFFFFAVTGGAFSIAATWTAGRKAVLEFAPAEASGTFFGVYGLTTKVSVLGILFFSIIADLSGFRSALWLLTFPALIASISLAASCKLMPSEKAISVKF